jgi:hypothetical protein
MQIFKPTIKERVFHPTRLFYTILFFALFSILGYFIPRLWIQYGGVEYYKVEQPVPVNQDTYRPCDTIVATVVRTSLVNVSAHSTVQIYLVNAKTLAKFDPIFDGNVIIEKSDHQTYYISHALPCTLPDGQYYLQSLVKFPLLGIEKTYLWKTDAFTVDKNFDPNQ